MWLLREVRPWWPRTGCGIENRAWGALVGPHAQCPRPPESQTHSRPPMSSALQTGQEVGAGKKRQPPCRSSTETPVVGSELRAAEGTRNCPFGEPPPPAPCTWAEEGGRPGACGLSGQTGRGVLAKPRGWRRPRPAYGGREGEQQLVKTGMKERDSGPAAASVPPPDSSPAKSSSYAPA